MRRVRRDAPEGSRHGRPASRNVGVGAGKGGRVTGHSEGSARGLRIRSWVRDSSTEVALGGELDATAVFKLEPALERLLAAPGIRTLALDLAEVRFIDSTGLGALLSIKDRATQLGIGFQIVRASEPVKRILDLTATRSVLGG